MMIVSWGRNCAVDNQCAVSMLLLVLGAIRARNSVAMLLLCVIEMESWGNFGVR